MSVASLSGRNTDLYNFLKTMLNKYRYLLPYFMETLHKRLIKLDLITIESGKSDQSCSLNPFSCVRFDKNSIFK